MLIIVIRVASLYEVSQSLRALYVFGVSLSCSRENASIRIVEHWMCGESWLAVKDL